MIKNKIDKEDLSRLKKDDIIWMKVIDIDYEAIPIRMVKDVDTNKNIIYYEKFGYGGVKIAPFSFINKIIELYRNKPSIEKEFKLTDVYLREGGEYSLYCCEWAENTANYEMRKEGCFAHSHGCNKKEQ